jgi:hypothetical protein
MNIGGVSRLFAVRRSTGLAEQSLKRFHTGG